MALPLETVGHAPTTPDPTTSGATAGPTGSASRRITGLDLARAMAMAGMVIVHYVWPDDSGSAIDTFATAMNGRAMPLFMLLGGVGVTLAISRFPSPDRALLIRAAWLFAMGVAVHELSEWVAVVLQWYGLLFAIAPLLRRLPSALLLPLAAVIAAAGAWTYQVLGTWPRQSIAWSDLDSPMVVIRALTVDGYYPALPVASFFVLGLWIGRLDLRSTRVAAWLAVAGVVVGIGTLIVADVAVSAADLDPDAFDAARRTANPDGFDLDRFSWGRLLDTAGHTQMPAWVLSAAGTSTAVVGLSLLVAPLAPTAVAPLVSLGRLALTFYVFQVALTKVVPFPSNTLYSQELLTVALIYFGFAAAAHVWLRIFRTGPLEGLLRIGSGRPARPRQQPPEPA